MTEKQNIVVIGASAGGIYALKQLAANLPPDFKAAVFIVQHLSATYPSILPDILTKAGPLKAVHPSDGEAVELGKIYIAPPDHHLLIEHQRVLVKRGPKENRFRPSIDALFRSAAYCYGPRVIGVVLTGYPDDGTSGLWTVKRLGGTAIVQNPEEAMYPDMPNNVLNFVKVDYQVNLSELAPLLCRLTQGNADRKPILSARESKRIGDEVKIAAEKNAFEMNIHKMGEPTSLTCPECHGTLTEFREDKWVRYRCYTGHGFTAESLLGEVTKSVEDNLWSTVRVLEEMVMLLEKAGHRFLDTGQPKEAAKTLQKAHRIRRQAKRIQEFICRSEQERGDYPLIE